MRTVCKKTQVLLLSHDPGDQDLHTSYLSLFLATKHTYVACDTFESVLSYKHPFQFFFRVTLKGLLTQRLAVIACACNRLHIGHVLPPPHTPADCLGPLH